MQTRGKYTIKGNSITFKFPRENGFGHKVPEMVILTEKSEEILCSPDSDFVVKSDFTAKAREIINGGLYGPDIRKGRFAGTTIVTELDAIFNNGGVSTTHRYVKQRK